jgi:hypothetical protein
MKRTKALGVALVAALAGSLLMGCSSDSAATTTAAASPEGLASNEVATMLDDRIAAFNGGDNEAAAAFYAEDAVLQEEDIGKVTTGRKEIGVRLHDLYYMGMRMEPVGAPIQSGRFVGEAVRFTEFEGTGTGEGVLVFELDDAGKIAHQWVTAEVR